MSRTMPRLASLALIASLATACTVDALDLEGLRCDCVEGWVCDEARDLCVRESDAAGIDAGPVVDAGPRPDGSLDAGRDAGAMEAGPPDAGDSDGGGADGGATDGGATDAGLDAGPPPDAGPCGGRLFCDGFESGDLSAWDGTSPPSSPDVTVSTARVHSGSFALRVSTLALTATAFVDVIPVPIPPDVYFRAWYYVPTTTPTDFEFHELSGETSGSVVLYSPSEANSNVHGHTYLGDAYLNFTPAVPRERWFCVELHLHVDPSNGAINVYYDDSLVFTSAGRDTVPVRTLETAAAGVVFRDEEQPERTVLFVDDVAVDTSRIGCAAL